MEQYQIKEYRGYKINVLYDEDAMNPREFENVATFVCEHKNYKLGDEHNVEQAVDELFARYVEDKSAISYFCKSRDARLVDTDDCKVYQWKHLYRDGTSCELRICAEDERWRIVSDMATYLSVGEKMELVEQTGEVVFLPISMYEHSGISIWLGGTSGCQDYKWDCGTLGFAYVERRQAAANGICVTEQEGGVDWKEWAIKCMRNEMEVYNDYVQGEVFGCAIEDEYGQCVDDCWGYYGTESIESLVNNAKFKIDDLIIKETEKRVLNIQVLKKHANAIVGSMFFDIDEGAVYRVCKDMLGENELEKADITDSCVSAFSPIPAQNLSSKMLDKIADHVRLSQHGTNS